MCERAEGNHWVGVVRRNCCTILFRRLAFAGAPVAIIPNKLQLGLFRDTAALEGAVFFPALRKRPASVSAFFAS
jgi:hypothetical protein